MVKCIFVNKFDMTFFYLLFGLSVCYSELSNTNASQCTTATLKRILNERLFHLALTVTLKFEKYVDQFSKEIDEEISGAMNLNKMNEKDSANEDNMKTRSQESFLYIENEMEVIFHIYTENLLTLLKSFSENFELLNEEISRLEYETKRIISSIRKLEKTLPCVRMESNVSAKESKKSLQPFDCSETKRSGATVIQLDLDSPPQEVWCNNSFDGGGWTTILRRSPQRFQQDFRRTFNEYEKGFGNAHEEYWIGLKALHELTSNVQTELFVDLEVPNESAFSRYNYFKVEGPPWYRLRVSDYNESSSGGNSLSYHNKMLFSSYDMDRDLDPERSCSALAGGGGFWFNFCYHTNPTGIYPPDDLPKETALHSLIEWRRWKGFHTFLTHLTMMIRPTKNIKKFKTN